MTTLCTARERRLYTRRKIVGQNINDAAHDKTGERKNEIEYHRPHYNDESANGKPYKWGYLQLKLREMTSRD